MWFDVVRSGVLKGMESKEGSNCRRATRTPLKQIISYSNLRFLYSTAWISKDTHAASHK